MTTALAVSLPELPTACACGSRHDGSQETGPDGKPKNNPGRKSWRYHEYARARHAAWSALPQDVVRTLPTSFAWSLYPKKEAARSSRFVGSWDELVAFLHQLGERVLPSGDKKLAPFISAPAYNDARSTDDNCEAIHVVWFDSDDAGTWDVLRGALERSGVAAIFAESTSRKATRWHLGIPLATPIAFQRGEVGRRFDYKLQYRHVAAILSALAGFRGVGGHCGLDLCTDRLVQPMFPALKRSSEESPARIEVLQGGALDWSALLAATEFEMPVALAVEGKKRPAAPRLLRPDGARVLVPFTGKKGPLGRALEAAGMLGKQKDANGVHAACPFFREHASGGEWDAIYFPGSDTWWCPHRSCKGVRSKRALANALPPAARALYFDALEKMHTYSKVEREVAPTLPHMRAWVEKHAVDREGAPKREKILVALSGAMLSYGYSDDFVVLATCAGEDTNITRERVQTLIIKWRANPKRRLRGAGWLRKQLGVQAMYELVVALRRDAKNSAFTLAKHLLSGSVMQGDDAAWLSKVHDGLMDSDPVRARVLRSTGCLSYGNEVRADGKPVHISYLVCEDTSCSVCFVRRVLQECQLVLVGWRDEAGRERDSWKKTAPQLYLTRIDNLADLDALESVSKYLKRVSIPKVKIITFVNGKPSLLLVTTRKGDAAQVSVELRAWSRHVGKGSSITEQILDTEAAIEEIVIARLAPHAHLRELTRERKEKEILDALRFFKKHHLVTRSPTALPWPSREAMRAAIKAARAEKEGFDPAELETMNLTYTLMHMPTRTPIRTQEFPFTIYEAIRAARESRRLQIALEYAYRDDGEEGLIIEQRLRDELLAGAAFPA